MLKNQLSKKLSLKQKILGLGGVFPLLALLSILYTAQIQMVDLHTEPICTGCASDYAKYDLDWNTSLNWTAGTIFQTFSDVDNSGTEFKFQYVGNTSNLSSIGSGSTPNIQGYFTDGITKSLSSFIDPGFSAGEAIQVVVSIDPPIPAQIGLELYHVNASGASGDKVQVYALSVVDGAKIYPTLTGTVNKTWEDDGNGISNGLSYSSSSFEDNSVGVNFTSSSLIDTLVYVWENCDLCGISIHGFGIGNIEFFSNSTTLPIEWGDMQVEWNETYSILSWHTIQELNADYFTIERSLDGKLYKDLANVSAKGNSTELSAYQYDDTEANFTGPTTLYYRIKQTDLDGSFSYSPIVELNPLANTILEMKLFPNPTSDYLTARLGGFSYEQYKYQVLTASGQIVQQGEFKGGEELELNVKSLATGIYQLVISGHAAQVSKAFQILRP